MPAGREGGSAVQAECDHDVSRAAEGSHADPAAAGLVHDLNNLLTVVLGSLEQLRRQPLDERGRQHLERAQWAAQQAGQLAQAVLATAAARGEVGGDRVVDLNEAVGAFGRRLGAVVENGCDLVLGPATGPLPVRLDLGELDRALLNLVRNAAAATLPGGQIIIRTAAIAAQRRQRRGAAVGGRTRSRCLCPTRARAWRLRSPRASAKRSSPLRDRGAGSDYGRCGASCGRPAVRSRSRQRWGAAPRCGSSCPAPKRPNARSSRLFGSAGRQNGFALSARLGSCGRFPAIGLGVPDLAAGAGCMPGFDGRGDIAVGAGKPGPLVHGRGLSHGLDHSRQRPARTPPSPGAPHGLGRGRPQSRGAAVGCPE